MEIQFNNLPDEKEKTKKRVLVISLAVVFVLFLTIFLTYAITTKMAQKK